MTQCLPFIPSQALLYKVERIVYTHACKYIHYFLHYTAKSGTFTNLSYSSEGLTKSLADLELRAYPLR